MQAPDEASLRTLYSGMPDGKLLEIAVKKDELTDTARQVLQIELAKRRITERDIAEFERYRGELELANRAAPIASSVNGCGTAIFGHRDERSDGSYVVTKWFTLFWVPLYRVATMRIKPVTLANGHEGYIVLEERIHARVPTLAGFIKDSRS